MSLKAVDQLWTDSRHRCVIWKRLCHVPLHDYVKWLFVCMLCHSSCLGLMLMAQMAFHNNDNVNFLSIVHDKWREISTCVIKQNPSVVDGYDGKPTVYVSPICSMEWAPLDMWAPQPFVWPVTKHNNKAIKVGSTKPCCDLSLLIPIDVVAKARTFIIHASSFTHGDGPPVRQQTLIPDGFLHMAQWCGGLEPRKTHRNGQCMGSSRAQRVDWIRTLPALRSTDHTPRRCSVWRNNTHVNRLWLAPSTCNG